MILCHLVYLFYLIMYNVFKRIVGKLFVPILKKSLVLLIYQEYMFATRGVDCFFIQLLQEGSKVSRKSLEVHL